MARHPIVITASYYPPFGATGTEYTTSLHAGLLVEAGYPVIVTTPNYGGAPFEVVDGVEVHRFTWPPATATDFATPGTQINERAFYSPGVHRRLSRAVAAALDGRRAHCIHANHWAIAAGAEAAARNLGVPFVAHVRNTGTVCALGAICTLEPDVERPPPHCWLRQHFACAIHRKRCGHPIRVPARVAGTALDYGDFRRRRRLYRRARRLAFASAATLDLHLRLDGFADPARCRVVYAPVVPGRQTAVGDVPAALAELRAAGAPILLFVGRLSPGKGADVLLAAHRKILERHSEARLVIAGNTHGWESDVVVERTLILGFVPRETVPALYGAADVALLPSVRPEPLGWTTLDAGLAARPIVASRVGGIPKAVEDGVGGFLVPPRDPEALASRAAELLDMPDRGRSLGKRAHAFVLERFGPESVTRQLLDLYNGLGDD